MNGKPPQRKAPAHPPVQLRVNRPTIVYLTVCTDKRKPVLARDDVHRLLLQAWGQADAWCVGRYVVMPDHIHLFCGPANWDGPGLTQWVKYWKSLASKAWPSPEQHPIWEKSCWDTQMRRGESYAAKWDYVRLNPVRKHLVAKAEDWPYQGEINLLAWDEP